MIIIRWIHYLRCANTAGSYTCDCVEGFSTDENDLCKCHAVTTVAADPCTACGHSCNDIGQARTGSG